jgi:hypothetical protein
VPKPLEDDVLSELFEVLMGFKILGRVKEQVDEDDETREQLVGNSLEAHCPIQS